MALPGWLIWGCRGDLRWVIQRTPLNSDIPELLSLLGDALGIQNTKAGSLDSLTRWRSLKEESCQAKTRKGEGRERASIRKRELVTSDFLGLVTDLCIYSDSCVQGSQNHFNESPFSLKLVRVGLLSILDQAWF